MKIKIGILTNYANHCFCAVFREWCIIIAVFPLPIDLLSVILSLEAVPDRAFTLSNNGNKTFQRTDFQVIASNIDPCVVKVENRVCAELLRTDARESMHKSLKVIQKLKFNL